MKKKDIHPTTSEEQQRSMLVQQLYHDIQQAKSKLPIMENAMSMASRIIPSLNLRPKLVKTASELGETFGLTPDEIEMFSSVVHAVVSIKRTNDGFESFEDKLEASPTL